MSLVCDHLFSPFRDASNTHIQLEGKSSPCVPARYGRVSTTPGTDTAPTRTTSASSRSHSSGTCAGAPSSRPSRLHSSLTCFGSSLLTRSSSVRSQPQLRTPRLSSSVSSSSSRNWDWLFYPLSPPPHSSGSLAATWPTRSATSTPSAMEERESQRPISSVSSSPCWPALLGPSCSATLVRTPRRGHLSRSWLDSSSSASAD